MADHIARTSRYSSSCDPESRAGTRISVPHLCGARSFQSPVNTRHKSPGRVTVCRDGKANRVWERFMVQVSPPLRFRAMELITILNRPHRLRGIVYQHAHFTADKKSIEVAVRARKGSAAVCSRCHLPAPGYDQLAERRFEFIPLWGVLVFLLYTMRRVNCRRCGIVAVEEVPWGAGKRALVAGGLAVAPYPPHGSVR